MNIKRIVYWLWATIGLLLCLNLATVGWIIRKVNTVRAFRQQANGQEPGGFIANRLGFSPTQLARYRQSRSALLQQLKLHEDSLRVVEHTLLGNIRQPVVANGVLEPLLEQMARQNTQITRLRFRHWQQVRAICTPDQQAKFDALMTRLEQELTKPGQGVGLRQRLRNRF